MVRIIIEPILITILLVSFLFRIFDNFLNRPFSYILKTIGLPQLIGYHLPGFLGLFTLVIITFIIGLIVTNVIGKKIIYWGEYFLKKVPLVWNIYYSSKQLLESISAVNQKAFKQVVLLEYPRSGIYTIGFLSSEDKGQIQNVTKKEMVNVFVPTTPNPTSGLFVIVPKEDIIPLSMSIEEGIKLVVSAGMVAPPPRG